jgi:pimeloyl-ACP methyl ester carboxylesterase
VLNPGEALSRPCRDDSDACATEGHNVPRLTDATATDDVLIVLVHGACHGPWCWTEVQELLAVRGRPSVTVELPLTSLQADAAAVRVAVQDAAARSKTVLLVGHSYGGVVISEAGHDAQALVYVAGTMPDPGQCAADLFDRLVPPELSAALILSEDGLTASISPELAADAFYNRCSVDVVADSVPRLRPMAASSFSQPVVRPAWRELPASYVVCADDHAMYPAYQRERAGLLGDSIILDCDHSAFFTAAAELADYLHSVAARIGRDSNDWPPGTGDLIGRVTERAGRADA